MTPPGEHPLILYDGQCGLCDRLVQFVLPRDPRGVYRFAALQSDHARTLLERAGLPTQDFDTMVLFEGGRVFLRSSAALRVLRHLSGAWPLLAPLLLVPRPIRDWVYGLVARHRHRLFGDSCRLPDPRWAERFLS